MTKRFSRSGSGSAPTRRCFSAYLLGAGMLSILSFDPTSAGASASSMLIDDFDDKDMVSKLGTQWRGVSDQVMGGVSKFTVSNQVIDGRCSLRLAGDVRLENNGGFIQVAVDLDQAGGTLDASSFAGVRVKVRGNGEPYSVHLRTPDNIRPWQYYRAEFTAGAEWRTIDIPFEAFTPRSLTTPLDPSRLRRIGLVAIGRAFKADLAISEVGLYR